jgi:hypothetical protein
MDGQGERIRSLDALRRRVPSIVQRINADPALALRAAANPLLALEELGYQIDPAVQREAALRIRFDQPTIDKLNTLAALVHELAGESFDIDSPTALGRVLFDKLKLPPLPPSPQRVTVAEGNLSARTAERIARAPGDPIAIPFKPVGGVRPPDPLEALRGAHPIIEPLLEYRAIQGSEPALASRELYDKIRRGEANAPDLRIRATLKRGPTSE